MPEATLNPAAKPGVNTTEYRLTKWVTILGSAIAVLAALGEIAGRVVGFLPEGSGALRWVSLGSALIVILKTALYDFSRTLVKWKAMQTGSVPDLTPPDANTVLSAPADPKPPIP